MKAIFFFVLCGFLFQDGVPYKSQSEFEVKVDLQFKPQPREEHQDAWSPEAKREHGVMHPYLILMLNFLKLSDNELRVKIVNEANTSVYKKKAAVNTIIKLDMGYTENLKRGTAAATGYTVYLLTEDRKPVSKIVINIDPDGNYTVNGEKLGKF